MITCVVSAVPTVCNTLYLYFVILSLPNLFYCYEHHGAIDHDSKLELCPNFDSLSSKPFQLAACRMVPWAKANLNYTAQALIISSGMLTIPTRLRHYSLPVFYC